jgi:glycosyltransferase involved in cell wall biosynthesis
MPELVSVVIPARNAARYLGEAIESVLAQHQHVEVIVVDNGSTDGSQALAESFGPPVCLLHEPHRGAAAARNAGVNRARGEYLAFLDADDLWAHGKLQRQLHELEARKDLDMVFCFGENFLSPDLTDSQRSAFAPLQPPGPFILPSAMLARRSSFLKAGLLPILREGEFIAWYGIALSIGLRSYVIPETLLRRRVHLSNSTRLESHSADLLRAAKMVLDRKKGASVPC